MVESLTSGVVVYVHKRILNKWEENWIKLVKTENVPVAVSYQQCDPTGCGPQSQNLQQTPQDPEQHPDKNIHQLQDINTHGFCGRLWFIQTIIVSECDRAHTMNAYKHVPYRFLNDSDVSY